MNPLEHIPEEMRREIRDMFCKELDDAIEKTNREQLAYNGLRALLKQMDLEVKNIMPNKDEN